MRMYANVISGVTSKNLPSGLISEVDHRVRASRRPLAALQPTLFLFSVENLKYRIFFAHISATIGQIFLQLQTLALSTHALITVSVCLRSSIDEGHVAYRAFCLFCSIYIPLVCFLKTLHKRANGDFTFNVALVGLKSVSPFEFHLTMPVILINGTQN